MCTLLLLHRIVPGYPVVLGANRDERFDRPATPPIHWPGSVGFVAPRDLAAGGTWIGVNQHGLVAAITNRVDVPIDARRSSRGELVRIALRQRTVGDAAAALRSHLAGSGWNGFNLLLADADRALAVTGAATLGVVELPPGAHIITHLHGVDRLPHPGFAAVARRAPLAPLPATLSALAELLASRTPLADGYALCRTEGERGTRSSAILVSPAPASGAFALPRGGVAGRFWFADGAPDRVPYRDQAIARVAGAQ